MPIRFRCEQCRQLLSISRRKQGKSVSCPKCGTSLIVPTVETAPAPPAPKSPEPTPAPDSAPPPAPEFVRRREPVEEPSEDLLREALPSEKRPPVETPFSEPDVEVAEAPTRETSSASADERPVDDVEFDDVEFEDEFDEAEFEDAGPAAEVAPEPAPAPAAAQSIPTLKYDDELLDELDARDEEEAEDDESGFQLTTRSSEVEDMDLTPMVDVTFLLLIFFMITASFSIQKSLETPPPDPEKKGRQQSLDELEELLDESINVSIDAENRVLVDDEPVPDFDLLPDTFRDAMRSADKRELLLTVDAAALHDTVVTVIDAAQEAGLQRIRLAGGEEDGE